MFKTVTEEGSTYKIFFNYLAIKCLICGFVSYNPNDIEHRYCGNCHFFHLQDSQYKED